jgi:MFS family permease
VSIEARRPGPLALAGGMLPAFAYYYTVGSVGFWIPLYLKNLGWSYSLVTWAATVYFAVLTPSTLASGLIADLAGEPGRLVCIGLSLNAIAVEAIILFHSSPALVFAARALQGLGLAAALPVALGALSLTAGVRRGVGLTAIAVATGMASGSLAGGLLASRGPGLESAFHTAALVSAAAAAATCLWSPPVPLGPRPSIREALGLVPPSVWLAASALVVRNIFASGVFSVLPVLFHRILGASLAVTAVALAANPVAQSATVPLAERVTAGRELAAYSLGLAGTALVFHSYLAWHTPAGLVAAQLLLGVDYAFIMIGGNSYILSRSPPRIRYTASSIYNLSFNTGWILGTLTAGPFMDHYGPEAWVSLSRLGCLAAGTLASATILIEGRRRGSAE